MKKRIVMSCIIIFVIAASSVLLFEKYNQPKTGYILVNDLFSKFEYKKELEKKYNDTKNMRQRILDSLAIKLRVLANQIEVEKFKDNKNVEMYNYSREEYLQKRASFEEENKHLSDEYDSQILKQLNQYVSEFGKKNNYQYIFGNDGTGSLLYAFENNNITEEVALFINKKYTGQE